MPRPPPKSLVLRPAKQGRGRPRGHEAPPERMEDGARMLREMKEQTLVLFAAILPSGPRMTLQMLALQSQLVGHPPDAGAERVLDLVLRLSPNIGATSGFARILRGATIAFSRQGFENARIEDILTAGDISPRSFYQFYRGKYDVLAALSDVFLSLITHMTRVTASSDASDEEKLRQFARILISGAAVSGDLAPVVVSEALRPKTPLDAYYQTVRAEVAATLTPIYERLTGGPVEEASIRARVSAVMSATLEFRLGPDSSDHDLELSESLLFELLNPRSELRTPARA